MKILHINDKYAATGGVTKYIFDLADLLERQGYENVVIYRESHERAVEDGRRVYYVPTDADGEAGRETIRRIVRQEQVNFAFLHAISDPQVVSRVSAMVPTLAYIHGFRAVCPAMAKYFRRNDTICERPFGWGCIPMIYLGRCSAARRPRTIGRIMRATAVRKREFLKLPKILVASRYMKELYIQNDFSGNQIVVLPYPQKPVPPEKYSEGGARRILYAGRLDIEKGIPYLLHAFSQLDSSCELRIAGDGTLELEYKALAARLGVSDRVHFLGWLDEDQLDAEYRKSRLLVLPSICPEAFGQVGIQAMQRCRPVVAFDVGGISDWLKDGWNGFLVPPKDVGVLIDRIEYLLSEQSLAMKMGINGREFVLQKYDPKVHIARLLSAFERVSEGSEKKCP